MDISVALADCSHISSASSGADSATSSVPTSIAAVHGNNNNANAALPNNQKSLAASYAACLLYRAEHNEGHGSRLSALERATSNFQALANLERAIATSDIHAVNSAWLRLLDSKVDRDSIRNIVGKLLECFTTHARSNDDVARIQRIRFCTEVINHTWDAACRWLKTQLETSLRLEDLDLVRHSIPCAVAADLDVGSCLKEVLLETVQSIDHRRIDAAFSIAHDAAQASKVYSSIIVEAREFAMVIFDEHVEAALEANDFSAMNNVLLCAKAAELDSIASISAGVDMVSRVRQRVEHIMRDGTPAQIDEVLPCSDVVNPLPSLVAKARKTVGSWYEDQLVIAMKNNDSPKTLQLFQSAGLQLGAAMSVRVRDYLSPHLGKQLNSAILSDDLVCVRQTCHLCNQIDPSLIEAAQQSALSRLKMLLREAGRFNDADKMHNAFLWAEAACLKEFIIHRIKFRLREYFDTKLRKFIPRFAQLDTFPLDTFPRRLFREDIKELVATIRCAEEVSLTSFALEDVRSMARSWLSKHVFEECIKGPVQEDNRAQSLDDLPSVVAITSGSTKGRIRRKREHKGCDILMMENPNYIRLNFFQAQVVRLDPYMIAQARGACEERFKEQLEEAMNHDDMSSMALAFLRAEAAGINASVIQAKQNSLWPHVIALLLEAVRATDPSQIKDAFNDAEAAGLAVCALEEVRAAAKQLFDERLKEAMQDVDIAMLRLAFNTAAAASLDDTMLDMAAISVRERVRAKLDTIIESRDPSQLHEAFLYEDVDPDVVEEVRHTAKLSFKKQLSELGCAREMEDIRNICVCAHTAALPCVTAKICELVEAKVQENLEECAPNFPLTRRVSGVFTKRVSHEVLLEVIDAIKRRGTLFAPENSRVFPVGDAAGDDSPRRGRPPSSLEGWVCYGLRVEDDYHSKDWHIAYHGTSLTRLAPIILRGLRQPGDKCVHVAHGQARSKSRRTIYLSPSIEYAAFPVYAQFFPLGDAHWGQMVLQCWVRPYSYRLEAATLGVETLDSIQMLNR